MYAKPEVRAVFLDRDGTININEPEYPHKKEDFKFIPGVLPALRKLSKTDYKIIIVTNQLGVGRGYFTEKDLQEIHRYMLSQFKKSGIRIDRIYYCIHTERDNCSCRKPKTGMTESAAKDFGLNLSKSWIVGDSPKDIQMGREANLKTIFVGKRFPDDLKFRPHYSVKNLAEAVKVILKK
ncbi:MAG: hypothetical protein A2896_01465 [Candidatus Nealsonbacteria bacterium RIFCSPLOWO2_01_FULL_43_32]|uniref:D,D-heptose 1,7-bisphosphate phosphatase n=1 Tax=Candidatus Nealsonbacteria bacterium RIFCSPLOWO2_01_FULL_43_32 TaxID=1801672 RepID=A0A1G2EDW8_9BACT|nr:MAG: hypothetical protein A2896_01465 [Candidatus Nealsonbacteria bacterium RIFCSPLOWO2_01_FULL_43_32]